MKKDMHSKGSSHGEGWVPIDGSKGQQSDMPEWSQVPGGVPDSRESRPAAFGPKSKHRGEPKGLRPKEGASS